MSAQTETSQSGVLDTLKLLIAAAALVGGLYAYYYYEADSWELYCLTDDVAENRNLMQEQPKVAAELSGKIHSWLTQKHPTWKPKYPIVKKTGESAGPPPVL